MRSPQLFEELASIPYLCEVTGPKGLPIGLDDRFSPVVTQISETLARKGRIYLIGNGGSSSVAMHIANDVVGSGLGFAFALCEPPIITALANDHGYQDIYLRQLQTALEPKDLTITISSSGRSANILRAAEYAASTSQLVTLSGMTQDNPLRDLGHVNVYLPFLTYATLEIGHLAILHESVTRAFKSLGGQDK